MRKILVGCGGTATPQESLTSVADQTFIGQLDAAKAGDYEAFATYFDEAVTQEEIQSQFEGYKNYEPKENRDIEIVYSNDTSFAASIFEYTNLVSGENRKSASRAILLVFGKEEGKWLLLGGDKLTQNWNDYAIPAFTDYYGEVVNTGYANTNHQVLFNKVLGVIAETVCKTAEFDENGDLQLTFSFINGLDNDIFDVVYDKLIVRDASNNVIADLSGYSLPSGEAVKSKAISDYTVTVPASKVDFNAGNDGIKDSIYVEASFRYQNRTN